MTATEALRGGVIVRIDGATAFVPAIVAVKVAPVPTIARLAGSPPELLGIALFEGALIPIVTAEGSSISGMPSLGPPAPGEPSRSEAPPASLAPMLVCTFGGEHIGIVGLDVVGSGTYPADPKAPDGVIHAGLPVPAFDVASLYARVQGTRSSFGPRAG